jgi:hypothetical protein
MHSLSITAPRREANLRDPYYPERLADPTAAFPDSSSRFPATVIAIPCSVGQGLVLKGLFFQVFRGFGWAHFAPKIEKFPVFSLLTGN